MYHMQVKTFTKQKTTISEDIMANTLCTNNYRDLWKKSSKTQKSKRTQPASLDNISDDMVLILFLQRLAQICTIVFHMTGKKWKALRKE